MSGNSNTYVPAASAWLKDHQIMYDSLKCILEENN